MTDKSAALTLKIGLEDLAGNPDRKSNTISKTITGKIHSGESLTTSFKKNKVDDKLITEIINGFNDVIDFKCIHPGDSYTISMDQNGDLVQCEFITSPIDQYVLTKNEGNLTSYKTDVYLEKQLIKLSGTISSSLFSAFQSFDEAPKLIYSFADIFASKIDFNTETRKGDTFDLLFEKYYKNNEFVGYGKILYAKYYQSDKDINHEGYYYSSEKRSGAFYDAEGKDLGSSFIRSPVPVGRISSGFTYRRKHPISNETRPHLGVDLAAPKGTPIIASADGVVKFVGWKGGFGKQVVIRHGNGYETHYGHLSKFKNGLRRGKRVQQKEIIGYVGSTGLSTGPHLDYRLSKSGVFMNPFSLKFKPKTALKNIELAAFQEKINSVMTILSQYQNGDESLILVQNILLTPEDKPIEFL